MSHSLLTLNNPYFMSHSLLTPSTGENHHKLQYTTSEPYNHGTGQYTPLLEKDPLGLTTFTFSDKLIYCEVKIAFAG